MATSFLDKTGLTSLWAKIKATFALKSEIPDSTSDLTNDSGFITTANIPQSDWSQNDSTAADYVKNRVCYTGNSVMTEIFSTTVEADDYFETSWNYPYFDLLEDGKEITLTIDGVTYNETLTWELYEDSSDEGYYYCGNTSIWGDGGEDTGESYVIQLFGNYVYGDFKEAFDHDVTITLSTAIPEIHKLDDKYLNGPLLKRGTGYMSVILNGEKNGLVASGECAVAEGSYTTASGGYSHAEGSGSMASGDYSHAEGGSSMASGYYSHSECYRTSATGRSSHSEGGDNYMNVFSNKIIVYLTGDANATTYTINDSSTNMHSFVGFTLTGSGTSGARVVSETVTSGQVRTITLDKTLSTAAVTNKSYQIRNEGTSASGNNSHTEGLLTSATAFASHAEGLGTHANHRSQHVFGEWNNYDPSDASIATRGNYVEIVGNGAYNAHSNARTLDWFGNEVLSGKLTVGAAPTANMDVATKKYVDDAVAGGGSAVTYTLSITNNVITLTGSDGSTSSVTLPVYAGGVSS